MAIKTPKYELIDKIFVGLLLVVFGGIVLHAPLSIGFGALLPDSAVLIKTWKEILLIIATLLGAVILTRRKQWGIVRQPIVLLIGVYALLHILLLPLFWGGVATALAGLIIDLRYLLFFVLIYGAMQLYPGLRRVFIGVFTGGALVVVTFALLQVFVLPPDILSYIGYNETTIMPYLTVDQNIDYIRINSTLRGPNPLGAYAVIVLSLLLAYWIKGKHTQFKRPMFIVTILGVGGLVALWASYSRSALLAGIAAIALVVLLTVGRRLSKWTWISIWVTLFALGGIFIAARDTEFVSNVVLHENREEGGEVNSNDGHIDSLVDGVARVVRQPLGSGIGSTGSASLYGDNPVIIENQYLFTAHESGWIGIVLFLMISFKVLARLWKQRNDWLSLGVLASGIGMLLIGLLLPVWVDDTVAIIWWGLAAIAIGGTYERAINKTPKRTA